MKKIYCYFLISFFMLSCSTDWLNLSPSTALPTDDALKTLTDAQSALNGIYRIAASHSYYGDNYLYYADCRGEDVQAYMHKSSGSRVSPYYEFTVEADDAFNVTRVWNQPYNVIRQINNLLEKIDAGAIETKETAQLNRIKGEALAMRGLALFDLTRMFGMPYALDNGASLGVPIEIKPTLPTHQPVRPTVAACYDQVISDMREALTLLKETTMKTDGRQNYWSVLALLSRIYLNKGDYENAFTCAVEVIEQNGGVYRLYTNEEYAKIWGQDFSSESLFEFFYTLTEPSGGTGGEGAPMVYADVTLKWTNLVLTEAFLNLLNEDPKDVRHSITRMPVNPKEDILPEGSEGKPKYLGKYPGKTGTNPQDNNICVIRLSEVYLNASEAALKLNKSQESLTYLNAIVTRANPEKTIDEKDLSLERILIERRKELVGEGQAFFDYLRNGKEIIRKGGWHLPTIPLDAAIIKPTDKRIILPIPQAEMDANPNMVQNLR